ncbi:hypothetical protein BUALT_Bualt10G0106900 [Buddleja alternifolia]|uniref:T-complex protein 1 subunit eta n=1 Tax=Buddleja alternifolia TaxID=168488 RepID=A0AAV6WWX4_9LAMI|nr:hypothetical protein BUALT_Bualt10G0106900 [Buddleja alternifolia]
MIKLLLFVFVLQVGDGTTTVVLLAGEFLKEAKPFIEDGVHPQNLIKSYLTASYMHRGKSLEEKESLLAKCAATTLSSKLIGGEKEFFATMVVDAVLAIGNEDRLNMIGIKKVPGGTMRDSFLVDGVAFKKTVSYVGFEQQPKKFSNPQILLLNIELELKSEKENAEISILQIVIYFVRVAAGTGGTVQTTVNNIIDEVLGSCDVLRRSKLETSDLIYLVDVHLVGLPQLYFVVEQIRFVPIIEEAERSLHEAIMIVRRAMKNSTVVAGGGAIDTEISRFLRQHARTIAGKSQLFINSYAKALEVIPRQLCDNAGFDATDVLNKLRQKHALPSGCTPYGVDINTGGIANSFANSVWEPAVVKINAINAATEAAYLVLSVDETVKNPKSESAQGEAAASAMGGRGRGGSAFRGRGRGMRRR